MEKPLNEGYRCVAAYWCLFYYALPVQMIISQSYEEEYIILWQPSIMGQMKNNSQNRYICYFFL